MTMELFSSKFVFPMRTIASKSRRVQVGRKRKKWIRQAERDPDAFKRLFDRYDDRICHDALRRPCDAATAKAIAASTFPKAPENIGTYEGRGVPSVSLLYRIATNESDQAYRKARRIVVRTPGILQNMKSDGFPDDGVLETEREDSKADTMYRIHGALQRLKPKYQAAVALRYFEDFSIREIPEILGLPESTVKVHIHRGLERIGETV